MTCCDVDVLDTFLTGVRLLIDASQNSDSWLSIAISF